jgi:ferric-dicitrate binding protein FerR (iron transport regulator)
MADANIQLEEEPSSAEAAGGTSRGKRRRWLGVVGALALLVVVVAVVVALLNEGDVGYSDTHTSFAPGSSAEVKTAGNLTTKVTMNAVTDPAISTDASEQP